MSEGFVFAFRRIASDEEGYYFDRWDRAVPISVIAPTEKDARAKAKALSGPPPNGEFWKFRLDGVSPSGSGGQP